MTLQQFGELIGVGKAAVFKWEAGINIPSPENAKLIERATDGAVKKGALRPDLWGRS